MKHAWMLLLVVLASTCKVRVPDAGHEDGEVAFPCDDSDTCPQPDTACLLAMCLEGQCVFVPAPDGVLPEEEQVIGDCKHLYCDGNGEVVGYASQLDLPTDDGNPCTEAVCDLDIAKQEPKLGGMTCALPNNGGDGMCNGAGTCGVCLPSESRCDGQAVATCDADGRWGPAAACATDTPVCSSGSCIGVVELASGSEHACARFGDGSVRCWGNALGRRLGEGGLAAAQTPSWTSGFLRMRAGRRHRCGVRRDGSVWCWGRGGLGQLGHGQHRSSASPVDSGVVGLALALGDDHSCALTRTGAVQCWGRNDHGQLGSGKRPATELTTPVRGRARKTHHIPTLIDGLTDAKRLSLDNDRTCVLRAGKHIACWGGMPLRLPPPLPDGTEAPVIAPEVLQASRPRAAPVTGLANAKALGCGAHHCCALTKSGNVSCWGAGSRGELGAGKADSFKATPVPGVSEAKFLGVGQHFACVVRLDGSVMCWGANDRGQLGTGETKSSDGPKQIATLARVQTLAVAHEHVCVQLSTAEVLCWGDNRAGQLGRTGVSMAREPAPVVWP